jgi:hypothetical protein
MRLRDIRHEGFYARLNSPDAPEDLGFQAVNVRTIFPMFIGQLAQFVLVPGVVDCDDSVQVMPPELFFSEEDDWHCLCTGNETGFGPHTIMIRLLEMGGYGPGDARDITRAAFVEALDRKLHESAPAGVPE